MRLVVGIALVVRRIIELQSAPPVSLAVIAGILLFAGSWTPIAGILLSQGKRERIDTIGGRVRNAHPGQQIIYAHSGTWWVQPWHERAFTSIRADSTWSTETHLGFECAVLLVDPEYHPLPTLDLAPTRGGFVALVKIVKGTGTSQFAPKGSLKFTGYDRVPLLESWQMEGLGL